MSLSDRLRTALRDSMRARDRVATAALRSALAALDNAGAVPPAEGPGGPGGPGPAEGPGGPGPAGLVPAGDEHFAGSAVGVGAAEVQRRSLTEAEQDAIVRAEIAERLEAADQYGPGPAADRLRAEAAVLTALRGG